MWKKKGNLQRTSSIHVPSVLNKLPFATKVAQENDTVKMNSERENKLPICEDTPPRALLTNALDTVITDPVDKQKLHKATKAKMTEIRAKCAEEALYGILEWNRSFFQAACVRRKSHRR